MKQVKLIQRMRFGNWKGSSTGLSIIASNEHGPAETIKRDGAEIVVEKDSPANSKLLSKLPNGRFILYGKQATPGSQTVTQFQEVTLMPKKLGQATKKEGVTSDFYRATRRISPSVQVVYRLNVYSNSSACVLEISEEPVTRTGETEAENGSEV